MRFHPAWISGLIAIGGLLYAAPPTNAWTQVTQSFAQDIIEQLPLHLVSEQGSLTFKNAHIRQAAHRGLDYEVCYHQESTGLHVKFSATHFYEPSHVLNRGYHQVDGCPVKETKQIYQAAFNTSSKANFGLVESFADVSFAAAIPDSWNSRTQFPACESTYNNVLDQAACGACYAFATVGALADTQCVSKVRSGQTSVPTVSYSVQDLLSCGTTTTGSTCINSFSGPITTYANGCDGGFTDLTFNYAVEQGLLESSCGPAFDVEDEPNDPGITSRDLFCQLTNNNPTAATIQCKKNPFSSISVKLDAFQTANTDMVFCECPSKSRSGYNGVVDKKKVTQKPDVCNIQTNGPATLKCGNNAINIGGAGTSQTSATIFCRCPKEKRSGYEPVVKAWETGYGRIDACTRPVANCGITKFYSRQTVGGELAIKQGILNVGTVVVDFEIYNNFQNLHSSAVWNLPATFYDSSKVGSLSGDQKRACDANPSGCAYFVGRHAVSVFGWGVDPTQGPFWLARNTWTKSWGDGGFFKIVRGKNLVGIENHAAYAFADPKTAKCPNAPVTDQPAPCVSTSYDAASKVCTVTNSCADKVMGYNLRYDTPENACGVGGGSGTIGPKSSSQRPNYMNCCVASENVQAGWFIEPGKCFKNTQNTSNNCVWKNTCAEQMKLQRSGADAFYSFPANAEFSLDRSMCNSIVLSSK